MILFLKKPKPRYTTTNRFFCYEVIMKRLLALCMLLVSPIPNLFGQKTLFMGSIQFPQTLKHTPGVRIYYHGKKLMTEIDNDSKRILFTVPEQKQRTFFYLLVTPEVDFVCRDNNVEHLRLKSKTNHKLYALELVAEKTTPAVNTNSVTIGKGAPQKTNYTWAVKEIAFFDQTGRIPDDALIICYDPQYINSFEGGSAIEFPKIIIRPDAIKLAGSEEKFQNQSTRWLLAALNTDMIHETMTQQVKFSSHPKTIIAFN